MKFTGGYDIPASPQAVWDAVHDPEVLRAVIPGAQSVEGDAQGGFKASVRVRIGPVSATFQGEVAIVDANPPQSLTLRGAGEGRGAGLARGEAKVRIEPTAQGARLAYEAEAQVGGKIAQLGQRLVDAAAKRIAAQFFANLAAHFAEPDAQAEAPPRGLPTWAWVGGVMAVVAGAALIAYFAF